jgi:hypothetical protein
MVWIPLEQRRTADQGQNKQIEDIDASEALRYLSSPPHQELPLHHSEYACEYMTMAKDKEPLQSLTGFVEQTAQTAEQIKEQTQGAVENYFNWLQNAMSALPWSNTNLNRILLSNATQNVTATFAFVQKLSQAENFQDVVKIQTEFMNAQLKSFNDQAKIVGEVYTKAAAATKAPFSMST